MRPALSFAHTPDLALWQVAARERLAALMGFPAERAPPAASHRSDHPLAPLARRRVYLRLWNGASSPLDLVWRPGREGPLPVMICLQGTNSGAHLSWGEVRLPPDPGRIAAGGDYARQAARLGYAALCLELSCFGERRETALDPRSASPTVDAAHHALLCGRTLLGERAGDVASVVDWIASGDGARDLGVALDPRRIRVMGSSAGGAVALYAAALDPRIGAVLASGCVGFVGDTIAARRDDSGQNVVPGLLSWFETDDVVALVAPRPLLAVSGTRDHIFPASGMARVIASARRAYAALGAEAALAELSPEGPHRFYADAAWPAFDSLLVRAGVES